MASISRSWGGVSIGITLWIDPIQAQIVKELKAKQGWEVSELVQPKCFGEDVNHLIVCADMQEGYIFG